MLDPLPPDAVATFRARLPQALDRQAAETLRTLAETGEMDAAGRERLMTAMTRLAVSLTGAGGADDTTQKAGS